MRRDENTPEPVVAMVVAGDVFGGAERQVITLCRAPGRRFRPILIPTLPGRFSDAARDAGLGIDVSVAAAPTTWECVSRLRRLFLTLNCQLVHTHGYRSAVIASLAGARAARVPVIRTIHGAPEAAAISRLAFYEWLGGLADYWSSATRVAVSRELASRIGTASSVRVIHNGIEELPSGDAIRCKEFEPDLMNLVAVGRLEVVKDLKIAIRAMADSRLRNIAALHIVGDGPERDNLVALRNSLNMQRYIHFHGFRPDALNFIRHANALVISSRHEGIPYVLLEALSVDTPVVATATGGIPEVIRDGREGLLVPVGDHHFLASAILRLHTEHGLASDLISAGRARIATEFSAELMAHRYSKLYEETITHHRVALE